MKSTRKNFLKMLAKINKLDYEHVDIAYLPEDDPRLKDIQEIAQKCDENQRPSGSGKHPKDNKIPATTAKGRQMLKDIVNGSTVAEVCSLYGFEYKTAYNMMHAHHIQVRPVFSYIVWTPKRMHKVYYYSHAQLVDAMHYNYHIHLVHGKPLKEQLQQYGMDFEQGTYHWYDIKDGDMYVPRGKHCMLTKNGAWSYGKERATC